MDGRILAWTWTWLALVSASCGSHSRRVPPGGDDTPDAALTAAEVNCFDGLDDNGDGLVDCADPTCSATATCAAAVPDGWTGHAALYDGAAVVAPGCTAPWTHELIPGRSGLSAAPATCGACTCSAPSNGACTPGGGADTVPPAMFARLGVACTAAAEAPTGCAVAGAAATGEQCVAAPVAAFVPGLCVGHAGDVACPRGPYSDRHVFFQGVLDARGCSACTCGAPSGGACTPAGGVAEGEAFGTTPTTFCCLP